MNDIVHKLNKAKPILQHSLLEHVKFTTPFIVMTVILCCPRGTQWCHNGSVRKSPPVLSRQNTITTPSCYFFNVSSPRLPLLSIPFRPSAVSSMMDYLHEDVVVCDVPKVDDLSTLRHAQIWFLMTCIPFTLFLLYVNYNGNNLLCPHHAICAEFSLSNCVLKSMLRFSYSRSPTHRDLKILRYLIN